MDADFLQHRLDRYNQEVQLVLGRIARDRARFDEVLAQINAVMDVIRVRTEYASLIDLVKRDEIINRALNANADKAEIESLRDRLDYEKEKHEFDGIIKVK